MGKKVSAHSHDRVLAEAAWAGLYFSSCSYGTRGKVSMAFYWRSVACGWDNLDYPCWTYSHDDEITRFHTANEMVGWILRKNSKKHFIWSASRDNKRLHKCFNFDWQLVGSVHDAHHNQGADLVARVFKSDSVSIKAEKTFSFDDRNKAKIWVQEMSMPVNGTKTQRNMHGNSRSTL